MRFLVAGFGLVFFACSASGFYGVVLRNAGPEEVDGAHVMYGNFVSAGGVLSPGALAGHGGVVTAIPDVAVVVWIDTGRREHRVIVPVKSVLPEQFFGPAEDKEIFFEIQGDGSVKVWGEQKEVGTWRREQQRQRAELRQRCGSAKVYSVSIVGAPSPDFRGAVVSFGSFEIAADDLRESKMRGLGDICEPIPEIALATWSDASGGEHRVELPIRSALRNRAFKGMLFRFRADGTVTVEFENG